MSRCFEINTVDQRFYEDRLRAFLSNRILDVHTHVLCKAFQMQAALNWVFCVTVSLCTPQPCPDQVTDQLTLNWKKLNILIQLGHHWYNHIVLWWALFVLIVLSLLIVFSGIFFK